MLVDGVTFTATGSADSFKVKSGATFPASPLDGQMFKLTTASGQSQPGLYYWDTAGSAWTAIDSKAIKGVDAGIATLNLQGKILDSQIPSIAISDTFVVASQVAMLALTAEVGDVAIRTDESKSYILQTAGASVLGNWKELLSGSVASTPYDIATQVDGKPAAAATVLRFTAIRDFVIAANMAGSRFTAVVGPAAGAAFEVRKNGSTFCTASFATAQGSATFSACAAQSFAAGDVLTIVAPAQDAALSDLSLVISGTSS